MFIKLGEDRRINDIQQSGKMLKVDDFIFSVDWIQQQEKTTTNPFAKILFEKIRDELEQMIIDKKKKRIFDKDEKLNLKPATIKEVTELLEHIDLHGVDEDLNGRMFETFLNATVRGKQLGQFFTPRSVVKFSTELADIRVSKNEDKIEKVLDYCCGSGGFLIEAMAEMQNKIESLPISNKEKDDLKGFIKRECLFGADVNEIVTRIARMNMYLHSDGGSRIYRLGDSLEKEVSIPKGIDKELERDIHELKKLFDVGLKFDVALTNPPFSMDYKSDESDDLKILKEYDLAYPDKSRTKLFKTVRSNVLFIERYHDLLNEGGRIVTILDDGALCTRSGLRFRQFVREKFIIEALISLPKNAFVNAEVHPNTSILFLRKKKHADEIESSIFIAKCENIGHNDAGKPTLEKDELPKILEAYKTYKTSSIKIPKTKFLTLQTNPLCFVIDPSLLDDEKRFDVYYYPDYHDAMQELKKSKHNMISLSELIEPVRQGYAFKSRDFLEYGSICLVRIRNLGKEGNIKLDKMVYVSQDMADQHHDVMATTNDLIMGMDGDDFRTAMIPMNFNGVINQRIAIIKTKPDVDPRVIMEYVNGRFGQIQLERKKTKTTAGHITAKDIENIKIPDFRKVQSRIVQVFTDDLTQARELDNQAKIKLEECKQKIQDMIISLT